MTDSRLNVLFVCTGNSARSIMAEGLLNHLGGHRFQAFSAGSHPKGEVHPLALSTLDRIDVHHQHARSKSWSEFAAPDAPILHLVFTVCDNAAGEICPIWPGQPLTAHWGVYDPSEVDGPTEKKAQAFLDVAHILKRRIELMLALPHASLKSLSIQSQLDAIGKS